MDAFGGPPSHHWRRVVLTAVVFVTFLTSPAHPASAPLSRIDNAKAYYDLVSREAQHHRKRFETADAGERVRLAKDLAVSEEKFRDMVDALVATSFNVSSSQALVATLVSRQAERSGDVFFGALCPLWRGRAPFDRVAHLLAARTARRTQEYLFEVGHVDALMALRAILKIPYATIGPPFRGPWRALPLHPRADLVNFSGSWRNQRAFSRWLSREATFAHSEVVHGERQQDWGVASNYGPNMSWMQSDGACLMHTRNVTWALLPNDTLSAESFARLWASNDPRAIRLCLFRSLTVGAAPPSPLRRVSADLVTHEFSRHDSTCPQDVFHALVRAKCGDTLAIREVSWLGASTCRPTITIDCPHCC